MGQFRLDLLGGFRLTAAATELHLPTRKAEALLAYLALPPGKTHGRDSLTALLWGERDEPQARHSLSQTLFSIRQITAAAGASPLVVVDARGVALDPSSVEVDADQLERLIAEGTAASLDQAATLYGGDLLAGLRLREAAFEEWLTAERSRLRELAVGALAPLLERHAAAGRIEEAAQVALRLLALDPLQESVHRQLMRLYVAQGRPASALKQYQRCARTLQHELAVEPEAETTALYAEIKRTRAARDRIGAGSPWSAAAAPPTPDRHGAPSRPVLPAADATAREPGAVHATALRSRDAPSAVVATARRALPVFGREAEFSYLHQRLDEALAGTRRIVFVTGEAGLGKTTLVEAFLDQIGTRDAGLRIGHGQCLEHRGPGEAYMPVLEALGRLCRAAAGGRELVALLARQAPSWLAQMPGLLDTAAFEALERRNRGVTRERMLREMVEAVEAMTAERPLVLVLEDLHWSDPSTVDLLARLVRRREPARLLVIGTYRPADVRASGHPLHAVIQELCVRGHCEELALAFLTQTAVEDYLAARFPGAVLPAELAGLLHQRTDGNPLFITSVAESWIAEGLLVPAGSGWSLWAAPEELTAGVPGTLRQLVEQQLERLGPEDREILEAASVAGRECSAAAVAAAVGRDEDAEARCAALARQGRFLHARGAADWPDGTIASRYGFIHDVYQEVLYDGVPAGRRARLHRRCGARLETGYGPRARERAAELAVHFVRGRDFERALRYLQLAADQALQRSAQSEAIAHIDAALEALRHLADEAERARWELAMQTRLGEILTATEGWSSAGAERAFLRARELCRPAADGPPELSRVLYGLANLYEFRGEFDTSEALIEQRLRLPADADDASFLQAQELLTCSLYHRGRFDPALAEAARGLARYRPELSGAAPVAGEMAVHLQAWAAMALWFLGHPDQALARTLEFAELGRVLGFPAAVAGAHAKGAVVHQLRRDPARTELWATTALQISTEQGFRYRTATASVFRGWALAARGEVEDGIALLHEGLAACRETGAEMDRPHYLALLAEACGHAGRIEEGLAAVTEGLAIVQQRRAGQPFFYEAELHRLHGVLLLRRGGGEGPAEASLRRALEIARQQQSRSLELRAVLDLARVRHTTESARLIEDLYRRFTEGLDTPDLIEARTLLDEVAESGARRVSLSRRHGRAGRRAAS